MQGNILISVLMLLAVFSLTAVYSARQGLLTAKVSQAEHEALQLEGLIPEVLATVEAVLATLPAEIAPVNVEDCAQKPCILLSQHANTFFEQPLTWWQSDKKVPLPLPVSLPSMRAYVVLEHLSTKTDAGAQDQYLRGTILLIAQRNHLQMQAVWRRSVDAKGFQQQVSDLTTLNSGMPYRISEIKRLVWRRK